VPIFIFRPEVANLRFRMKPGTEGFGGNSTRSERAKRRGNRGGTGATFPVINASSPAPAS
jgi:hypothetical protein